MPLPGSKFFHFMQFSAKNLQKIPNLRVGAPPSEILDLSLISELNPSEKPWSRNSVFTGQYLAFSVYF